jgi:small-conductance mechanosensitive channel
MSFFTSLNISPWIGIPLVYLLWVFGLAVLKKAIFAIAKKFASKTKTQIDDILFEALDFPIQLVVYASGLLVIQSMIPKETLDIMKHLLVGFKVVCILAVILFVDKFLTGLIKTYAARVDILRTSGGFAHGLVHAVIFGLGVLVILDSMGISVTPIIASLGIGSLAIALALQPTLENLFAGIQLVADKPVQIGQFIKLESGEEGSVSKIGWRSTWITLPNNNTVVIPNKILVNSRLTNFFFPNEELAIVVPVGVHYHSDLEKVERITLEVARETMKSVEGGVVSAEPAVRFTSFGDSAINFNVVLRSRDFQSSAVLKHDFIKRLQKRYAKEGIIIPYPTRTIIQEK